MCDERKKRHSPKVLVVDDDSATRAMVFLALETQGYDVLNASGGFRLIGSLLVDHPHLVILSAELEWMAGMRLCQGIRGNPSLRDIRILVLSRDGNPESQTAFYHAGADAILVKPVDLEPLLETVAILVGVPEFEDEDDEIDFLSSQEQSPNPSPSTFPEVPGNEVDPGALEGTIADV